MSSPLLEAYIAVATSEAQQDVIAVAYIAVATFETQQDVIAVADTPGEGIRTTACTSTAVSRQQAVNVAAIQTDSF